MSALGQKQTFAVQNVMSALPPKADIRGAISECPLSASSGHCRVSEQCPPAFGSHLNHVLYALSAFDLMASLNPRLYPASKWSDLLKSRTLEMLCSSGG